MLKDPVDIEKRKPRRLRGTPANKYSFAITFGIATVFYSFMLWYSNSEAEWIQRRKQRHLESVEPSESDVIRKEIFQDPYLAGVVVGLNERIAAKQASENDSTTPRLDETTKKQ